MSSLLGRVNLLGIDLNVAHFIKSCLGQKKMLSKIEMDKMKWQRQADVLLQFTSKAEQKKLVIKSISARANQTSA